MLQVIQGKVPSTHENARLAQVIRLCNLIADCWELDPKHRPTAVRCCDQIGWMVSWKIGSEIGLDPTEESH